MEINSLIGQPKGKNSTKGCWRIASPISNYIGFKGIKEPSSREECLRKRSLLYNEYAFIIPNKSNEIPIKNHIQL